MVRWCYCWCPRKTCSVLIIFLITGVYNLTQFLYFAITKLEEASSDQSLVNTTYPSVLVPPALEPGLVVVYNNITMVINLLVILSSLAAWLAVCKELSFLLLPWILSFFVSVIYECLVFVYLITNKKTSFNPVSAFVLAIDFLMILVMVLFLVRIFNLYDKMRRGLVHEAREGGGETQDGLVEESSEIASARVSSIYRKSFYKKTLRNQNLKLSKKLTSLSKISEEDSENIYRSDNHNFDDNIIEKDVDKEMFSDKAVTSSTSDNPSQNENNNDDKRTSQSRIVSRFVPEILSRNKVTIV